MSNVAEFLMLLKIKGFILQQDYASTAFFVSFACLIPPVAMRVFPTNSHSCEIPSNFAIPAWFLFAFWLWLVYLLPLHLPFPLEPLPPISLHLELSRYLSLDFCFDIFSIVEVLGFCSITVTLTSIRDTSEQLLTTYIDSLSTNLLMY